MSLKGIEFTPVATSSGTNDRNVTLHDMERRQCFLDLGLHLQIKKVWLYLCIGISNHCDLFIDWSLARFLLEYYSHDVGMLCQVTQNVPYFSCELRLLGYFFNIAASRQWLNVGNWFLL
jgi:hypothetical protein